MPKYLNRRVQGRFDRLSIILKEKNVDITFKYYFTLHYKLHVYKTTGSTAIDVDIASFYIINVYRKHY